MTLGDITTQFVHKELTPFPEGKPPNQTSIDRLLREVYANAAAIPSSITGNSHGCLYVVTTPAQYTSMTTETYTIPTNPGMAPNYPTAASNAQIAAANRTFEAKEKAYKNYEAVDTGTKRQLVVSQMLAW